MNDEERKQYLKEVKRKGSTIGAKLPEVIEVGGDELKLNEFLIETRKVEGVPPEAQETIAEAVRLLQDERKKRVERLENDAIDHETAAELVTEINGIDRALNALKNIRKPSYGEQSRKSTVEDYKKWFDLLDTVRG